MQLHIKGSAPSLELEIAFPKPLWLDFYLTTAKQLSFLLLGGVLANIKTAKLPYSGGIFFSFKLIKIILVFNRKTYH